MAAHVPISISHATTTVINTSADARHVRQAASCSFMVLIPSLWPHMPLRLGICWNNANESGLKALTDGTKQYTHRIFQRWSLFWIGDGNKIWGKEQICAQRGHYPQKSAYPSLLHRIQSKDSNCLHRMQALGSRESLFRVYAFFVKSLIGTLQLPIKIDTMRWSATIGLSKRFLERLIWVDLTVLMKRSQLSFFPMLIAHDNCQVTIVYAISSWRWGLESRVYSKGSSLASMDHSTGFSQVLALQLFINRIQGK